jgi:plasmid maintenance system killer protein
MKRALFWDCFHALPGDIQRLAREKYQLWEQNCFRPSLHFKPLKDEVWSVRINQNYRAFGATQRVFDRLVLDWHPLGI